MFKYMWKTLNLNFRRSIITLTLPFKWDFIKHLPLKCRRNSETGSETCYYSHKELEIEHASKRLVDNFRSTEKLSWYQHSVLGSVYRFFFFFSSQALEDKVWDLLHEADKAAEENKEKSQVYDAMAETLGDAWDTLIIMLEKRQALLELTMVFFENALEVCI